MKRTISQLIRKFARKVDVISMLQLCTRMVDGVSITTRGQGYKSSAIHVMYCSTGASRAQKKSEKILAQLAWTFYLKILIRDGVTL